ARSVIGLVHPVRHCGSKPTGAKVKGSLLAVGQSCRSPGIGQEREYGWFKTGRDGKTGDRERRVKSDHPTRCVQRFLPAAKPHQGCRMKKVTDAEARVRLNRAPRRVARLVISPACEVRNRERIVRQVVQ